MSCRSTTAIIVLAVSGGSLAKLLSSVFTRDGNSSYFINNQPVRRRDVQDVFLGPGLARAYAITLARAQSAASSSRARKSCVCS